MALTVTATQGGTGTQAGLALTVKVLTGAVSAAAQSGATGSSSTVTAPQQAVTPGATGSYIYGAVTNEASATSFTANGSTTFTQNVLFSGDGDTFGTFRVTSKTTASTPVTAGASAPTETTGFLFWAAAEILTSGTLAEDASSPAVASTTAATTLNTASFSPPAGSLLVAQVSSNYTGTGTLTMTVSGGGLTWTQLAGETLNLASVWIAQVPSAPSLMLPPLIPPGPFSPMAFVTAPPPVPPVRTAATYYVSSAGSDSNNGTGTGTAWKSIARVNSATLNPGDTVLFNGGNTFSDATLTPVVNGVTFGSYGTGQATLAYASGTAVYAYEVGGITVENLTITGPGASTAGAGGYAGVYFNRDVNGYAPPVTVTGCTITGWADGILAGAANAGGGYSGITITGNQISANRDAGVNVYGSGYSHQNVTITGNSAFNQTGYSGNTATSSGHGIVVGNASGGTVAQNVTYGNGASCGCTTAGPVGNWAYSSQNLVIEYNVSYGNLTSSPGNADGDGFDLDDQCVNCTLQYNIAYENDGAGIACYSDDSTWSGNVIRYNVTWGNSVTNPNEAEIMFLGGAFANCQVYGNTFIGQTNAELPSVVLLYGATFTSVNLWNNIFYSAASGVSLMYTDTAYTGITFQGNLWYSAAPFVISWGGTSYSTMAAWRTATGQEKLSGGSVGLQADPLLIAPGTAPAVISPSNLAPANGLELSQGSPAAGAGLNMQSLFSVNPGTQDFFGDPLAYPLSVGAYQASPVPSSPPPPLIPPGPFSPMAFAALPPPVFSSPPAAVQITAADTWTGTDAASASGPVVLVQETSGSTTGTSLTLTLGTAATTGNGLIIAVSGFAGSTISGITIGGTGSLFTQVAATSNDSYNAQVWYCASGSVSSASIVVTAGASGIIGWAYEVSGTITPDQNEWTFNNVAQTSWSSGATGSTLPVPEFIVGVGATVGTGSTSIAGPGGWTNQSAINGVHAGSDFYSGVSGYQAQTSTSATYDYSGTTGSATWGAVTATFVCMATQTGWGGYQFREHSSYTGISATFTIPSLSGEAGALSSMWVGLGGGNYNAIYQTGIYASYNTGSTGNNDSSCWSWWLPGAGELWNTTTYPTKAGDSLTLTVQLTSTDWLMTIANNTEAWSYTEVKSVLAVNVGSIQNSGAGPAAWPYPSETAQIIIEKEGSNANPDYGSVEFTSITTTPAVVTAPFGILTVNTGIDQYPGEFNTGSGSFTMYWNGYT